MRLAILADIHGNLPALEAALAEVERLKPDHVLIAGDVVNGSPDSAACWEKIKALKCPVVRGNHERYIADFGTERAMPAWQTQQFAPLHYTHRQLSPDQRKELGALPLSWRSDDLPGFLLVHSSLRSDADSLFPHTPETELSALFPGLEADLVVRAHNHLCMVRDWNNRRIVTCGSVGLPLDGEVGAQFTTLALQRGQWKIEQHLVRYDVAATLRRFHESGYLEEAGPIARLFMREVATATHQLMPFLRYHASARKENGDDLASAVERFLSTDFY